MPNKIDSNLTGLRYADETSLGVLPGAGVVWKPLEPNSYGDFGGNVSTTARNPMNASRQRRKGAVTGKEASASFELDLTLDNMYDLLQGFLFADWRKKDEDAVTVVVDGGVSEDEYTVAAGGTDYRANDLVLASGHAVAANNGIKIITTSTATAVRVVTASLVAEAAAPAGAKLKRVGHQFAAGDATIAVSAGVASLNAVAKNMTQFGLIPGEWVYLGGDNAAEQFLTNANNRGFCRVATVTATKITFDKTQFVMTADAGTAKTVRIFFGDVIKNENTPALIKQRSYTLERQLSVAGTEYVKGAVPNELSLQLASENKVTVNLAFVGIDSEMVTFGNDKAGTRPALATSSVAFNTVSDISRLRLDKVDNTGMASYLMEASVTINNGVTPAKALGVLGAFDVSLGDFAVSSSVTAYFNDVAAVTAVNANADISLDFALVARNTGMLFDVPLLTLSNARLQVAKDTPIKLPLSGDAAAHGTLDHTLLVSNYAYLPTQADV